MEWSSDKIINFINEVEAFPVIWNPSDAYYKIPRKKNDAWSILAVKFKTTTEEVKKKWQSLQASFRREKLKEINHSGMGTSEKCISKWFAYQAMMFVGDRYTPRSTTNTTEISEASDEIERFNNDPELEKEEEAEADLATEISQKDDIAPIRPTISKKKTKIFVSPKVAPPKKKKEDSRINEVYNILKTTIEENAAERTEPEVYGEYVAKTLNHLDNHSRIIAKYHINQVLFNAEMGQYRPQSQPGTPSTVSCSPEPSPPISSYSSGQETDDISDVNKATTIAGYFHRFQ